jgi:hypothetical protein
VVCHEVLDPEEEAALKQVFIGNPAEDPPAMAQGPAPIKIAESSAIPTGCEVNTAEKLLRQSGQLIHIVLDSVTSQVSSTPTPLRSSPPIQDPCIQVEPGFESSLESQLQFSIPPHCALG